MSDRRVRVSEALARTDEMPLPARATGAPTRWTTAERAASPLEVVVPADRAASDAPVNLSRILLHTTGERGAGDKTIVSQWQTAGSMPARVLFAVLVTLSTLSFNTVRMV